jgi:hypothetical protein
MLRQTLSTAILVAAVATSQTAHAGDAALAESLFREGRAQMDAGNFVAACPKLAESYAQDAATGTLLALAMCQEQAGQTASAWATYSEVVARAKQDGRADREQAAREAARALEPKLSRLTINVEEKTGRVAGVVVKRDGIVVGRAAWGQAAPVDPGTHVVKVTARGKVSWTARVVVALNADAQVVQVPMLDDDVEDPPVPPHSAVSLPSQSRAVTEATEGRRGVSLRMIGLVTGGAGIATLGVSGYFGVHASSLNRDSKSGCDANNNCDAAGLAKRNDAVSASNITTITLVAGGVLTAAGVTLFLVGGPKETKADAARVEAAPVVGPGAAAMLLRGRF